MYRWIHVGRESETTPIVYFEYLIIIVLLSSYSYTYKSELSRRKMKPQGPA